MGNGILLVVIQYVQLQRRYRLIRCCCVEFVVCERRWIDSTRQREGKQILNKIRRKGKERKANDDWFACRDIPMSIVGGEQGEPEAELRTWCAAEQSSVRGHRVDLFAFGQPRLLQRTGAGPRSRGARSAAVFITQCLLAQCRAPSSSSAASGRHSAASTTASATFGRHQSGQSAVPQ